MNSTREKDLSVETLRGLAIILVVAGHVIGYDTKGGMRVADDSFLRHMNYTLEFVRIPLFTVLSGWVYSLLPANRENLQKFYLKKARRLMIPMFVVGAAYFLLQHFVPGTNNKSAISDMWRLLVFPFTLYWYLPSLFLVFLLVAWLDSRDRMKDIQGWLFVFAMAMIIKLYRTYRIDDISPNFFSYKGLMNLLPFFVLGVGIHRFKDFFSNRKFLLTLLICLIACLIIQQLSWYGVIEYTLRKGTGVGLIIGLSASILLLSLKWNVKALVWIGGFSYTIYLFHAFGTAGARIITHGLGIYSDTMVFLIALTTGLILPILLEKLFNPFGITRMLFLGRNYILNTKGD